MKGLPARRACRTVLAIRPGLHEFIAQRQGGGFHNLSPVFRESGLSPLAPAAAVVGDGEVAEQAGGKQAFEAFAAPVQAVVVDAAQAREEQRHHEARALPDAGDDDAVDGHVRVDQPAELETLEAKIEQVGTPMEVYHFPATRFVAGFIGSPVMNFLPGTLIPSGTDFASLTLPSGIEIATRVPLASLPRGAYEGVLDMLRLPFRSVEPQVWKGFYGIGASKREALHKALVLYPDAPVRLMADHNKAEALLIAHWALRTFE